MEEGSRQASVVRTVPSLPRHLPFQSDCRQEASRLLSFAWTSSLSCPGHAAAQTKLCSLSTAGGWAGREDPVCLPLSTSYSALEGPDFLPSTRRLVKKPPLMSVCECGLWADRVPGGKGQHAHVE